MNYWCNNMNNKKIDFVMTWVDGNDENWKKEKRKYSVDNITGSEENRFRDWDNLQYWFRGVEKFTPWVNQIHFITCGHIPKWLNINHPKLNIVKHSDYMDERYLPTFSSHPIELNIHKIDGLSEKFVYFNDDTFILKEMKETDFFKNNLPCAACGFEVLNPKYDEVFFDVMVNNIRLINRNFDAKKFIMTHFGKIYNPHYDFKHIKSVLLFPWALGFIPGFINPHLPNAYLKSTLEKVWEKEGKVLDSTSCHKFRSGEDVNQYVFQYWQYLEGNFTPINMNKQGMFYYAQKQEKECINSIIKRKYKMICVNDDFIGNDMREFENLKNHINCAFQTILPKKSNFEL